jgi:hypothetical protein
MLDRRGRVASHSRRRGKGADWANRIVCITNQRISVGWTGGPGDRTCVPQIGRGYAIGKIAGVGAISVGVSIRIYDEIGVDALPCNRRDRSNRSSGSARNRDCAFQRSLRGSRRNSCRWRNRSRSRSRRRRNGGRRRGSRRAPCQQTMNNCQNCRDQNKIFCIHGIWLNASQSCLLCPATSQSSPVMV